MKEDWRCEWCGTPVDYDQLYCSKTCERAEKEDSSSQGGGYRKCGEWSEDSLDDDGVCSDCRQSE